MDYTMAERGEGISRACLSMTSCDPAEIFRTVAAMDFIRIHGPEHHMLNGAAFLTAFKNAGGNIDLEQGLAHILREGQRMPGAVCGLWGVCGAVTSVGAALAFIESTGPLSTDDSWGSHMGYTSAALGELAAVGGPRCCKRDGFLALRTAVAYGNERFGTHMECSPIVCTFSGQNAQCLHERCPFYGGQPG